MAVNTGDARTTSRLLAGVLLRDVERIAERSTARMQERLPSYGNVPRRELTLVVLASLRNLLEAINSPDPGPSREQEVYGASGEKCPRHGITSDEMLYAWRIGLEVVREEAYAVAEELEIGKDGVLEFVEAALRWGDIGMRARVSRHHEAEISELDRIAKREAALRRVATMVARGATPGSLFDAVAEQVASGLRVPFVSVVRFEADGTATGCASQPDREELFRAGTQWSLDGTNVLAEVRASCRPARINDHTGLVGKIAGTIRRAGIRSTVATPIIVGGEPWGAIAVSSPETEPLPADTESRLTDFSELVATAISNVRGRSEVEQQAEEQAALRRVATMVARECPPEEVLAKVAEEVGLLLTAQAAVIHRYEPEGDATVMGSWGKLGGAFRVGSRSKLDGDNVTALVYRTERLVRLDDYDEATGSIAADAHKLGLRSAVGSPIIVNGRLWGAIGAASSRSEPLPADAGTRISDFTELVATAIANVQVRTEVLRLTEEQAALQRVATMVARAYPAEEVFAKVAEEVGLLLDTETVGIDRFEPDGDATVVGSWGKYREAFPVGSRLKLAGESVTALVYRTRRPVRVGSYEQASGAVAADARKIGLRSAVGSPIVVNGRLWGAIGAATSRGEPMPANAESWIAQFTELVATAIANLQARAEIERLAGEQTALRRVATLVALGTAPDDVFAAVSEEVARLLPVDFADMGRYESDGTVTFVATWSSVGDPWPLGSRWTLGGHNLNTIVFETGRPARMDNYADASGPIGVASRETGVRSAVGTPIIVEGRLWGVITADSTLEQPLPADTEARLASFTELVATAIANAESRADLAASRARIVAAADETRRQIERDLHDRAQQQLVSLVLELRVAEATETSEMGELRGQLARTARGLDGLLEELREISRGIHPAVLSEGGLEPALRVLARRSAIPVELGLRAKRRPPEPVEVAAYYVASEALTNAAKHAQASVVHIELDGDDANLRLAIRDDGIGGADPGQGSGLVGLSDRIEAVGGKLQVDSPNGNGTTLLVEIPLEGRS